MVYGHSPVQPQRTWTGADGSPGVMTVREKHERLTTNLPLGMRPCIPWGTGLTWSAEWGHIAVVTPSPTQPCRENLWSCSTWPSLKTSPTTFRLEAMQLQGFGKVCLTLPRFGGELSTRSLLFVLPLSSQMDCCCVERNKMVTFILQIPLGVTYAAHFFQASSFLPMLPVKKSSFWQPRIVHNVIFTVLLQQLWNFER